MTMSILVSSLDVVVETRGLETDGLFFVIGILHPSPVCCVAPIQVMTRMRFHIPETALERASQALTVSNHSP